MQFLSWGILFLRLPVEIASVKNINQMGYLEIGYNYIITKNSTPLPNKALYYLRVWLFGNPRKKVGLGTVCLSRALQCFNQTTGYLLTRRANPHLVGKRVKSSKSPALAFGTRLTKAQEQIDDSACSGMHQGPAHQAPGCCRSARR
jgi:hypothetical protein